MRVETRKLSNGKEYYSFVYWDGEKRVRLKRGECPNFDSLEKAQEWAKIKEADIDCSKSRALERVKWKNQYYDFSKISDEFIEYCKNAQPNYCKNTEFFLEQYVFRYFLQIKKSNNLNNWSLYFEDFKDWLETSAYILSKKRSQLISYNSKNHCIKALNSFLDYAIRKRLVDSANVQKIKGFPQRKLGARDAEALIDKEEFCVVHGILKEINPTVAIFFECAYWTGMRANEIYGLSLNDLFNGQVEDSVLGPALISHGIEYFGFINLQSQPATKVRIRLKDGTIKRKPLKGKPSISTKYNRLIPIDLPPIFVQKKV